MPIWWLELVIGLYDSFFYFCEAFFCAHWSVFWHACSIVLTHTNLCKKVYAIHISKGSQKVTHESMSTPCHKRALKPLFKFWKRFLLWDTINSYIIDIGKVKQIYAGLIFYATHFKCNFIGRTNVYFLSFNV